jgi:hypothetical protein
LNFLNAILLLGGLAFLIPLLIHLLNKRRVKVVHWGAVHLLQRVMKEKRRRVKVENWLLLLLRVLIPIILALCLARPVLTKVSSFLGSQGTSAVVLLDDSFSMGAGGAEAKAQAAVGEILAQLPNGSDAHVVRMGGGSRPLRDDPTTEPSLLRDALEEGIPSGNAVEVDRSLRDALGVLGEMKNGAREVVIVSDFQKSDWRPGEGARASAMAELSALPVPPEITLYPVGEKGDGNLAIESVQVSSIILGAGQEFVLRVDLRDHGGTSRTSVPVNFFADEKLIDTKTLQVAPGGVAQAIFRHRFEEPGAHQVEIQAGDDEVPEDNRFYLVLDVRAEIGVALIDGAPSNVPLGGESDFVELALQPFSAVGEEGVLDLIKTEKKPSNQLRKYVYEKGRVVVLANVENLDGGQLGELRRWVHDEGGTVLTFPGDGIDVNFYNEDLFEPGNGQGIFPCRIASLARAEDEGGAAGIQAGPYTHPALVYFNSPGTGDFSSARFRIWYRLEVKEGDADVLLRMDNGDPLLVERTYGKGRVIGAAIPCDTDWGNLPAQPAFLPLMQRLVTYLASSSSPPINLQVGTPIRGIQGDGWKENEVVFLDPAGSEHRIEVSEIEGRKVCQFDQTTKAGIYTMLPVDANSNADPPRLFALNYERAESEVDLLSPEEIDALAEEMEARVVRDVDSYAALDRARRVGLEIWRPVLYLILALLFLEIIFQQYLSRAKN